LRSKIHIWLFVFSAVALIIGIYQFIKGETWEPILSILYFIMFLVAGIFNLKKKKD